MTYKPVIATLLIIEDAVALRVKEVVPAQLLENQKIIYSVSKGDLDKEIVKYCKKK